MDKAQTFLDTARRVIRTEANGLMQLADNLGGEFAQAVELMLGARGRVIVSGMGKSGHVARKIAATLASTGTPAQFVHPAEASHGDLGTWPLPCPARPRLAGLAWCPRLQPR